MTTKEIFLKELGTLRDLVNGVKDYPTETYMDIIDDLTNYFESLKVVRVKK